MLQGDGGQWSVLMMRGSARRWTTASLGCSHCWRADGEHYSQHQPFPKRTVRGVVQRA